MLPIVAAIFGGYRTIAGPLVGAVVVYLVDQLVFRAVMAIGHQIVPGAIMGQIPVTRGQVTFDGQPLKGMPTWRMRDAGIAMIPEGRTIVLVEQNTQRAVEVADRVCLMQGGRIVSSQPAAKVDLERLHRLQFAR